MPELPAPAELAASEYEQTAKIHAEADARCGRAWVCACGACKIVRAGGDAAKLAPMAKSRSIMLRLEPKEHVAFLAEAKRRGLGLGPWLRMLAHDALRAREKGDRRSGATLPLPKP